MPATTLQTATSSKNTLIGVGVGQRTWDDLTYGTLSSDGRRVYSIEDVQVRLRRNQIARVSDRCRPI